MDRSEPRILILDDDPAVTGLLADILQQEGYQVHESNSPKDVLFLARNFRPDLLLLDIMMPEVDGYDVCQYFRRDPELKLTRIVILTARDDRESRVQAYKVGADVFVPKPFELDELREIIRTNIASKLAFDQIMLDLQTQTTTDRTINCYHRKYMEKRIGDELKRVERHSRHSSLLLIDLDNFKQINIRYGFAFGNELLRDVAQAVRQELREFDLLGRYQEDSFLILLPDAGVHGAKAVASRIQEIVSSMVFLKKQRLSLRATVIHSVLQKGSKLEDALHALEEELAKVKAHKLGKITP